jgi:hypothetical protein
MDQDHVTTPPQSFSSIPVSMENVIKLSKATILEIISNFPFEHVTIPTTHVSDNETETIPFLEALGASLIRTLIQHLPKQSSPQTLLLSSTRAPNQQSEQETQTNPTNKEKKLKSSPPEKTTPDNTPMTLEEKRRLAMENMRLDDERGTTTFKKFTLIRTDVSNVRQPPQQSTFITPEWNHPRPTFFDKDAGIDELKLDALKKLNIDNDPYQIARLVRKQGELHPSVYIRGEVQVPYDNQGKLSIGFTKEYYDTDTFTLLNTGNDDMIMM